MAEELTPKTIVDELDKYIVGQKNAKKAVAVALRNRWRRLQLPAKIQEDITPKNIIMIGSTGVGKTEIARRLARLTKSPFLKVEASKYTEVGYVGRDVESMIRDLVEIGVNMVRSEQKELHIEKAKSLVEDRILDILLPPKPMTYSMEGHESTGKESREKMKEKLAAGELNDRFIEIDVDEPAPHIEVLTNAGFQDMGVDLNDMMKNMFPNKKKKRKMKISEARGILEVQELNRLIDMDDVKSTALKRVEQSGIVFLDEIDKIGSDYRGDPASALLEALDPEQNNTFTDHYLETELDLSKVFFITTANSLETIPAPLLDRMEVIRLSGYTEQEKLHIARGFLIPKELKEHNVEEGKITVTDNAVMELITYYTKEAGVRSLERNIASLIRKSVKKLVTDESIEHIEVDDKITRQYLGPRKFRIGGVYEDEEMGVATGLAWTQYGGDLLQIEVALFEGSGKLIVTGHLGDVMKESANIAYSVVKSTASDAGVPAYKFKDFDIHLHVPEGAVPKDGPSAGITMATAILSAVSEKKANCKIAMTGEITLRGKVLQIGGLKEKVLAAHRAGIRTVICPIENEKDLTDIPEDVRNDMEFKLVSTFDEVRALVLK